jgi:hypothetical protein
MDFPTSDVEIHQILTKGEAFDDVVIFGSCPGIAQIAAGE